MKRNDLIRNKGYWIAKIQLDLFEELTNYMNDNNLTRTKLAKKFGVSKGYITQILNGDFDHRISKLVDLAISIGKIPIIKYENIHDIDNKAVSHAILSYEPSPETTEAREYICEENIIVKNNIDEPELSEPITYNYF